jgi:AraC family transcriptional regulator
VSCIPAHTSAKFHSLAHTEYVQVQILPPLWNQVLEEAAVNHPARATLRTVFAGKDALVEEILLQLLTELQSAGKGSRLYVASLSKTLVVHITRRYLVYPSVRLPHPELLPEYKLKKVQTYIQDKLYEKISLHDLSALVGFSTFHFARLFKATTGQAPYQYIQKLRMEHCQRLLLETNLPVIQIGFEVGIENPSHFSSFFKQYTGLTPTAYRKLAS